MISPGKKLPCARTSGNARRLAFAGVIFAFGLFNFALAFGATLTAYRTHWTHGYYSPPGSLSAHLWEQWESRTNGRQPLILSNLTMVDWNTAHSAVWNTNWYFYGNTENFTAQSHVRTNDPGGWWTWRKSTVLSRVLIMNTGHGMGYDNTTGLAGSNNWYLFLDATNGQHWRRVVYGIARACVVCTNYPEYPGPYPYGDRYLGVLNTPLPTNIGTMKVLLYEVATNKLPFSPAILWPYFFNSQHSRTEGSGSFQTPYTRGGFWQTNTPAQAILDNVWSYGSPGLPKTMYLTQTNPAYGEMFTNRAVTTDNMSMGGVMNQDSGSPTYIVVSNRLVFLGSAYQSPAIGDVTKFLTDVNTATVAGGYTTNTYPVEFETLSGFPNQ